MGVASKHFGPIVLALNQLMKDVTLFLITFTVVMVAFASGVSYIFNMASGTDLQAQNGYSFVSIHFRVCLVSIKWYQPKAVSIWFFICD